MERGPIPDHILKNIMKRQTLIAILFALAAVFAPRAAAQNAGIKTNLLGWAVTNPNLGLEFGTGHRGTINLSGAVNPWNFSDNKHFHSWIAMPEFRYWFCEKFTGWFLGVHALGGQYNAKNVNFPLKPLIIASTIIPVAEGDRASSVKGWPDLAGVVNHDRHAEGWFAGGGITAGYQWMLSKHWNLETSLGIGYAYSKLTLYGRCARIIDERKLHYVGPTHANVSFMYVF